MKKAMLLMPLVALPGPAGDQVRDRLTPDDPASYT
jgi:hypothetical protein